MLQDSTEMDNSDNKSGGVEEVHPYGISEKKNDTTGMEEAMPGCSDRFHKHGLSHPDPWTEYQAQAIPILTQQMNRMQQQMECLMVQNKFRSRSPSPVKFSQMRNHPSNMNYPSTASVVPQRQTQIITTAQITQIEDAYRADSRTLHEIRILKSILQSPEDAEEIVSKRLRYLAKASLLGWRAAEDLPSLAEVAMLTPQETEILQRKQLESVVKPQLPPAFQQNKPLTATNVKVPLTDRLGKPIRNPNAYLAAMMKNGKN
jgi:hypothetical protein